MLLTLEAVKPISIYITLILLEELVQESPEDATLRRNLAQAYHQAGRVEDAVKELDAVAEALLDSGKKEEAIVIINQILLMGPPNAEQYRKLLIQLQEQ